MSGTFDPVDPPVEFDFSAPVQVVAEYDQEHVLVHIQRLARAPRDNHRPQAAILVPLNDPEEAVRLIRAAQARLAGNRNIGCSWSLVPRGSHPEFHLNVLRAMVRRP
jgi:hypothetical protein